MRRCFRRLLKSGNHIGNEGGVTCMQSFIKSILSSVRSLYLLREKNWHKEDKRGGEQGELSNAVDTGEWLLSCARKDMKKR